jgi:hypothetical protein
MSEKIVPYTDFNSKGKRVVHFTDPNGKEVFVSYDPKTWGELADRAAYPQVWSIFKQDGETKQDVILRVCGSMEYHTEICNAWLNGGGGGGGPPSPPRVPREQVVPWAPARAPTYAQRAQSKPEMPDWMIEGEKLKNVFPEIEETYGAYKLAVETAIEAKKAADAAAQEAYKAAIAKAGGGKKKPHVPVGLTDKIGSFADEADSEEEV